MYVGMYVRMYTYVRMYVCTFIDCTFASREGILGGRGSNENKTEDRLHVGKAILRDLFVGVIGQRDVHQGCTD